MSESPPEFPAAKTLASWAEAEVAIIIGGLPEIIREQAANVPVSYLPEPGADLIADGVDCDVLGLFAGEALNGSTGMGQVPAQILLFLENLWWEAERDRARFLEEVRITYLHELGHYLGWDEEDVEERGL